MNDVTEEAAEIPAEEVGGHPGLKLDLPGLDPDFKPPRTGPVIGIDLGTTNSCIGFVQDDGKPMVIKSRDGYATIPSIVAFSPEGKLLVGHAAKGQMVTNPKETVYGAKRLVGRPFDSPMVGQIKLRIHYQITEGPNHQASVKLGDEIFTLEEISALILNDIRISAEQHLNRSVTRAVITCPAFYNEHQRAAVREAGRLAGLHVERVLNEPTSAALAFGYGKGKDSRVVIFDLGGGTFDATLLEIKDSEYTVLSTGGDTFLGGVDFDHAIVDYLLQCFREDHGIPFRGDKAAMQRLIEGAEQAKKALSEYTKYKIHLPFITTIDEKSYDLDVELDRDRMNILATPLVDKCIDVIEEVLLFAGVDKESIDDVLLVGGSTRMLFVRERLKAFFGIEPSKNVHPDEAVALGAALIAHADQKREGVKLVDVNPMSIGIKLPAGRFKKVIERNQQLPVSKSYSIGTTQRNQREMQLEVFQGEADKADENEVLGMLTFTDLPKGEKGDIRMKVNFHLSEECILTLTAMEESTGREVETTLATKGTPAMVLRQMRTRTGVIGTGSFQRPEMGFMAWLKRLFGR
jgi:molecular chaperone DnaK